MKKIFLLLCVVFLVFPNISYANGAGLPPFFKINGKYSISNPLQLFGITAQSFLIPQDFTADNYRVHQPINFEVDESQLIPVIGLMYLKNTKYSWDFGDGTKAEGLKNSHTYTKIGSYILVLTINMYTNQDQQPIQFIDSFLLNILPENGKYTLPQAIVKINHQWMKNPLEAPLYVNFSSPISFDASDSKTNSSQPVVYIWNFGDGQTSTEQITQHRYADTYNKVVILRVKDSNGFISDGFVGLNNDVHVTNTSQPTTVVRPNNSKYLLFISPALIVVIISSFVFVKYKRGKRGSIIK